MTNTRLLRDRIKAAGYMIKFVAKTLNLSKQGFTNKMYGRTEFTQNEIMELKKLLNLTNEEVELIFFSSEVDKTSTQRVTA